MTPGARVAAAIAVLDEVQAGRPAEQALTRWARASRFAGSKDRAAVRDYVFDVLRTLRSSAAFGEGSDGRALMIGWLRQSGADLAAYFSGEGHAPSPLTEAERALHVPAMSRAVSRDLPDWLLAEFDRSLGAEADAAAELLRSRAPVSLRVNLARMSRDDARDRLMADSIATTAHSLSPSALTVTENPRKIRNSAAYTDGLVELQDAASQAVVDTLTHTGRVLDYCAGGGGKALAMAVRPHREVFAHDLREGRMRDIPARAARAGVDIPLLKTSELADVASFDLVLCDVPCSGSGAWRRNPDGKWSLTQSRLNELNTQQDAILSEASRLVAPGGTLAYATCSVLSCENEDRVRVFLAGHPQWTCVLQRQFGLTATNDGLFVAHLTRV